MKLNSTTALPHIAHAVPHVFETCVDTHNHAVAVGEGQVVGCDIHLAPADATTLESLAALTQLEHPGTMVRFAELDGLDNVEDRMSKVFDALEDGAPVMFLCRNSAICEAALEALHVDDDASTSASAHAAGKVLSH